MGEYFVGITDKGKRREHNEDTFIASEFFKKDLTVACVIDGVGGYSGGDVAAAITRSVILDHLKCFPGNILQTLHTAIITANLKIQGEKKKNPKNEQMACVLTCAVADIKHNKLYYAHVGDTRLYLLRDHSLVKLSKDHSVIGFLEESGRLSEEDAMRHPRRNEITKALGFEENISTINDFIEMGESPFLPGDMILVCSDGLSDMISSNIISSILLKKTSLAEKARELVAAANDAGGNDNITAVIVQNYNPPTPKVALKPPERKNKTEKNQSSASNHSPEDPPLKKARLSRSLIVLLTLLSLGILAVLAFKKNAVEKAAAPPVLKTIIIKPGNQNLDLLMRSLSDSSRIYSFKPGTILLNLAAPLFIRKDSFCIKGNAVTVTSDSNYKGPAIIFSNTAKQIILDSIVFKNFDVAMVVQKNNIELRNVRFINCRVPVEFQIPLPDTILSGRFKDSIFIPVSNFKKQ